MTMWMRSLVIALGALLLGVAATAAGDREVTVMTRNVYNGVDAEFAALIADPANLFDRVTDVYLGYYKRIFPARAQALADEIGATAPDFVALQEAVLVRVDPVPDGPASPAELVVLDFVQILIDALAARGMHYEPVVISEGLDAELPASLGFDVRHTDREVILVRRDPTIKTSSPRAGHLTTNCEVLVGSVPVRNQRGWVSVDVEVRGRQFRLVSTHLEGNCGDFTAAIQVAQANEILAGPAATPLPVVVVGDFNSSAAQSLPSAYATLSDAGFTDAWLLGGFGDGFTCCQDSALLNPDPQFTTRIDLVFLRGNVGLSSVQLVGATKGTVGVWASDHAGVVATVEPR